MINPCKISEKEKTPLVTELLHIIQAQREDIQRLRDEIAHLKEHKGKPKIPPSRLEKDRKDKKVKKDKDGKRPGSKKRSKTKGVLSAGLDVSDYINVDDTGARHAGNSIFYFMRCAGFMPKGPFISSSAAARS